MMRRPKHGANRDGTAATAVPGAAFSLFKENRKEEIEKNHLAGHEELEKASSSREIIEVKNRYLAKKGPFAALYKELGKLSGNEKAAFGKAINEARGELSEKLEKKLLAALSKEENERLLKEKIDISLPGTSLEEGHTNPFYLILDEIVDIFVSMGYDVVEGEDVETVDYNFTLLNIPSEHPSRDPSDTFYLPKDGVLRTQTSAAQGRVMQAKGGKGAIKVISPGKCYRRDEDDLTHSHQFGQVEGLVVDKGVSLAELKGTLEIFAKKMFGEKREIRFRSSYFPFTEPSVEVDVSCANCGGKGCSMCKGTGWIEILGAGEVHPNVLRMNGYDPSIYSGFAFGVGIDRVAILRYGIDDIRRIYANDKRFLSAFKEE